MEWAADRLLAGLICLVFGWLGFSVFEDFFLVAA
jgi:hypothetical protein